MLPAYCDSLYTELPTVPIVSDMRVILERLNWVIIHWQVNNELGLFLFFVSQIVQLTLDFGSEWEKGYDLI